MTENDTAEARAFLEMPAGWVREGEILHHPATGTVVHASAVHRPAPLVAK